MSYKLLLCIWLISTSRVTESETIEPSTIVNNTEIYLVSSSNTSDDIICTESECNIFCDSNGSCRKLNIFGQNSDTLTLDCNGELSCENIKIINGAKYINDIYCSNKSSCYNADFDLSNTSSVNIICNYSWLASQLFKSGLFDESPCHSAIITAENIFVDININCGAYGCYKSQFYINGSNNAQFDFAHHGGYQSLISNTYIKNELILNCNGDYSCSFMDIYCPFLSQCTINCNADYKCTSGGTLYIDNRIYDNLNLNFANSDTKSSIDFTCIGSAPSGSSELVINNINNRYECNPFYDSHGFGCCPNQFAKDIYTCDNGKDCSYECTDVSTCENIIIDGKDALSLTITCNGESVCEGIKIICPSTNYSSCHIVCNGRYSCQFMTIEANKANYINEFSIVCTGYLYACNKAWIMLDFMSINTLIFDFASKAQTPISIEFLNDIKQASFIDTFYLNCTFGCGPLIIPFTEKDIVVHNLDMYCAECANSIFNVSVTKSMSVLCDYIDRVTDGCAANFNIILLNNSINVNIDCRDENGFKVTGSCSGNFNIISEDSINSMNSVSVICSNSGSCGKGIFNFTNINDINMNCAGSYSCLGATVYGMNNNNLLEINCNNERSCDSLNVFCPTYSTHVCRINCNLYEKVCQEMIIYANNEYNYNYLQLQCPKDNNGCEQGGHWSRCKNYCVDLQFNCYSQTEYLINNNHKINTNFIYDSQWNDYKCVQTSDSYCCPWIYHNTTTTTTTTTKPSDQTAAAFKIASHHFVIYQTLLFIIFSLIICCY